MYYAYVLRSLHDHKLYIGYTDNLTRRYEQHQKGLVTSTKCRLPVKLIFYEAYQNKYDALRRESYLKTDKGKKTLQVMLREYFNN
ncbi:MAG: GIY-YIG nuclease family protein [Patescibacteria group bacterium]|jgi:putative endonuclease